MRLRWKRPFAVSQKTQSSGHPTCDDSTDRVATLVAHQHRFDARTVGELEEKLARPVDGGLLHRAGRIEAATIETRGQLLAQR